MQEIVLSFHRLAGGYPYMGLFFLSLLFVYIVFRKQRELWFYPNVLILLVLFNPIIIPILNQYFLIGGVSWRIWWIIPVPFLIAIMFTKTLDYLIGREKIFATILICVTIILAGNFIFNSTNFSRTQNRFQLPDEIIYINRLISHDSVERGVVEQNVVAVSDVAWRLRLYNPEIRMLYGRGVDFRTSEFEAEIFEIINSHEPDFEQMDSLLEKAGVSYIVVSRHGIYVLPENLTSPKELGYELIGFTEHYRVYRTNY